MNSEKDMKSRKALAWVACNKLNKICKSSKEPPPSSPAGDGYLFPGLSEGVSLLERRGGLFKSHWSSKTAPLFFSETLPSFNPILHGMGGHKVSALISKIRIFETNTATATKFDDFS